ncbi:MAG: DUF2269 domain-containing protein [Deltaproteobacteria bacterium]|nr:DUF2269 domain-containing protein [Deltaproteobacteria bacterium]
MAALANFLILVHVLAACVFLGTGLGTAWVKVAADRHGALEARLWAQRFVVHADLVFTIPAGVVLPASGLALASAYGIPWSTPWVATGLACWAVAGAFWLPAWRLQYRMRDDVEAAVRDGSPLSARYHRDTRRWLLLGFPSFLAALIALWVMCTKVLPF